MSEDTLPIPPRAVDLGLVSCRGCSLVSSLRPTVEGEANRCPRCGKVLHARKPQSLKRGWALVCAAALLYVPANILPIMRTNSLTERRADTILSGVAHLWEGGSWDLALIVFVASIVVPLAKMISLTVLLVTTGRQSIRRTRERAFLFRVMELIGHWSMLDVFVVALLVTLVKFGAFADIEPESGVIAFAGVVVLTMLASSSFDPRLIWDAQVERQMPIHHTEAEGTA